MAEKNPTDTVKNFQAKLKLLWVPKERVSLTAPLYGKSHNEETKELMRQKALGRKHSEDTKLLMSSKRGNFVNIYERCDKRGFKLTSSFVSSRRAAKFLGISGSTVVKYMKSGEIFKYRYKFSPQYNYY